MAGQEENVPAARGKRKEEEQARTQARTQEQAEEQADTPARVGMGDQEAQAARAPTPQAAIQARAMVAATVSTRRMQPRETRTAPRREQVQPVNVDKPRIRRVSLTPR